jgi:polar amino acid transport system substrate-binding protein
MITGSVFAEENKNIEFYVDEWCPYNCDQESNQKGYVVDLAKAVFKDKGYNVKVHIVSWSRAINMLKKGKSDMLFGFGYAGVYGEDVLKADKELGDQDSVKMVKKMKISTLMGVGSQEFYGLKSKKINWDSSKSLVNNAKNYKIGIQQDYDYGEEVAELIKKHPQSAKIFGGDNILERLIKLTNKGRIDLIPEDKNVIDYTLKDMGLQSVFKSYYDQPDLFKEDSHLLMVFSPKNLKRSQKLNRVLSEGIEEFRKNGKLKAILKKYGLKDWK